MSGMSWNWSGPTAPDATAAGSSWQPEQRPGRRRAGGPKRRNNGQQRRHESVAESVLADDDDDDVPAQPPAAPLPTAPPAAFPPAAFPPPAAASSACGPWWPPVAASPAAAAALPLAALPPAAPLAAPPNSAQMQLAPGGPPGCGLLGGPSPPAQPEGVSPTFMQRSAALHAELANTILTELSSNPELPPATQQSLFAQLQASIAHTQQPAANAWRSAGGPPAALPAPPSRPTEEERPGDVRLQSGGVMPLSEFTGDIPNNPSGGTTGEEQARVELVNLAGEGSVPAAGVAKMHDPHGMPFEVLARLFREPKTIVTDEGSSEFSATRSHMTGLAVGVNKKVRHLLLRQNKLTNRFEGSPFAQHAEITYAKHVTRTQLPSVKRRLAFFAVLLPTISLAHAPRKADTPLLITQHMLSIGVPALILLLAAWLCTQSKAQRHWQWVVVVSMLLADSCNICSDAFVPFEHFTPRDKDFHLLALFSNPSLRQLTADVAESYVKHLRQAGSQLSLGRELKSLLRSVPSPYVFIEPAATLADVRSAILEHNPQIAVFSGHSLVGSLVLELPDGSVDLPSHDSFIDALVSKDAPVAPAARHAPAVRRKLRVVVLNGCETLALARSIVARCPELSVVCWQSLTDDSAARAFMCGFYRVVGADLTEDALVSIEAAYRAGVATFAQQGFVMGDPSPYLHQPGHLHTMSPRYGECEGCSPPVHGQPALVSCRDGKIKVETHVQPVEVRDGACGHDHGAEEAV